MSSYFRSSRNVELSTIQYLEAQIEAAWTSVTVVKSFTQAAATNVPVVAVYLADTNTKRFEIGATTLENTYYINIDVFAKSDAMRLDLTDFILDKLKDGWINYTYSHASGDNTTLERTADGRVHVREWVENSKLDFGQDVEVQDRYRQFIRVLVRKD